MTTYLALRFLTRSAISLSTRLAVESIAIVEHKTTSYVAAMIAQLDLSSKIKISHFAQLRHVCTVCQDAGLDLAYTPSAISKPDLIVLPICCSISIVTWRSAHVIAPLALSALCNDPVAWSIQCSLLPQQMG